MIDQGVDLGGEPAARAAEVLLTTAPRPAGEALRLGDRRIHHDRLERVLGHAGCEQRVPDPGHRPPPVAALERVRLAEPFRQVLPGDAGAQDIDHGFHELAQPFDVLLPDAGHGGQLGMERRPGGVAQTISGHPRRSRGWCGSPSRCCGSARLLPSLQSVRRP
jgi:hypothetical protein